MTQNGFFLEGKYKEAEGKGQGMIWYDPASKSYQAQGFSGDGSVSTGTLTVTGRVFREIPSICTNYLRSIPYNTSRWPCQKAFQSSTHVSPSEKSA